MIHNKQIRYIKDFGSLFYPRTCVACGSDGLDKEQIICWGCLEQLPRTNFEKQPDNNIVAGLFTGRMPVQMATGFLFFGKESLVQHLIHRFKYKANLNLGVVLGNMMGKAMLDAGWQDAIDIIVPLPLNKKKQAKRGFNQAEILAKGIGQVLCKPVEPVAVIRSKFTETQTRKSREDRWENVAEVFELLSNYSLDNKHVLLVDDVVTTGATLEACGQVLLKTPGLKLSVATFAFASKI